MTPPVLSVRILESSSAIASFSFETSQSPPRYLSASRMTLDVRNLFLPAILMELPISVDCDSKYASKPKPMITRLISTFIRMPIPPLKTVLFLILLGRGEDPLA
jgi:hypothetical protein